MESSIFDRIPPQNQEAEQAVLAAMMLDKDAIYEAIQIVKESDFYKEGHSILFQTIVELTEKGNPVDLITITERLRKNDNLEKVGGVGYIAEIANSIGTATSVAHYANIVKEKSLMRHLIQV